MTFAALPQMKKGSWSSRKGPNSHRVSLHRGVGEFLRDALQKANCEKLFLRAGPLVEQLPATNQ